MLYVDSSAWVALFRQSERRFDVVRAVLATFSWQAAGSRLVELETERSLMVRAVDELEGRRQVDAFREHWEATDVLDIDDAIWDDACELAKSERLRAGDALHLALVRRLGRRTSFLLTFDRRMAEAAQRLGIDVLGGAA